MGKRERSLSPPLFPAVTSSTILLLMENKKSLRWAEEKKAQGSQYSQYSLSFGTGCGSTGPTSSDEEFFLTKQSLLFCAGAGRQAVVQHFSNHILLNTEDVRCQSIVENIISNFYLLKYQ